MEGKEQAVKELNEKFAIAVEELKKTVTQNCVYLVHGVLETLGLFSWNVRDLLVLEVLL